LVCDRGKQQKRDRELSLSPVKFVTSHPVKKARRDTKLATLGDLKQEEASDYSYDYGQYSVITMMRSYRLKSMIVTFLNYVLQTHSPYIYAMLRIIIVFYTSESGVFIWEMLVTKVI